jgi:2-dehydro-3-deoxyphosphogluconate aldolase / (4S)-4-hydroxy-2-oxoglutarate aldolase
MQHVEHPIRRLFAGTRVIPVLVIHDLSQAVPLAQALVDGGLRILEITLRTPVALEAVIQIRRAVPEAVVGVGTLLEPAQFSAADAAGAQFGVSPGLTQTLADASRKFNWPLLPGVMTPSELLNARELGFTCCKFYPAEQAGGINMLKALHAIVPEVSFCPTGGISPATAPNYLALPNVFCVGGSWVAPTNALRDKDWKQIRELASSASGQQ